MCMLHMCIIQLCALPTSSALCIALCISVPLNCTGSFEHYGHLGQQMTQAVKWFVVATLCTRKYEKSVALEFGVNVRFHESRKTTLLLKEGIIYVGSLNTSTVSQFYTLRVNFSYVHQSVYCVGARQSQGYALKRH